MTRRASTLGVYAAAIVFALAGLRAFGPDSPLADAAEKKDRARVRALLTQHAAIDAPQADGTTALHWAVYHDDAEMVDQLVRAGASAKVVTRYGVTPLSLACTNGSGALVERLLAAGADANATLPGGETPLMTASRSGSLAAVKSLLAHGAAVNAKDETRGQTALMWAAGEGYPDVAQALIAAGADIHARVASGFTPFLFAVREGRLNVVRVLIEAGASVNETIPGDRGRARGYGGPLPRIGMSALLLAVSNAHFSLASELLDAGADPNADLTGYTALHEISVVRKPGVGDNDPAPDGSGTMTSLELVKKLVAKGANVNAKMTKKVNLNNTRANEIGATPFMLAALTADAELMKALVALGADPSINNVENSTPLMMAAGLATRSPGEDAGTEREVLEAVQVALSLGNDINAVDKNGETVMHSAAYKNLPQVVKLVAARGARVEIWSKPDRFGWTPLDIAIGYRFGNFKPSPETEAAIREVMTAAGVAPPKGTDARTIQIYATRAKVLPILRVWW